MIIFLEPRVKHYIGIMTGFWHLDLNLDIVTGIWYTHVPNFVSLSWFEGSKRSMSCKSSFEALEDVEGSWLGIGILILNWMCSLVFDTPMFWNWLSILILKVQRTSMSFKSWFGYLLGVGGSWLGFGILILIWIWSLACYILMFLILALYPDFEGAKNIHVL